jgi:hypothetical protein
MIQKIRAHERYLSRRKRAITRWKVPAAVQAEVLKFVEGLELGKVNRGKRISEGRQAKYLDLLRVPLEFISKPLAQLRVPDIERFEKALSTDRIQSRLKGKPYAASTKADMRKAIKVFLRWRLGEAKALQVATAYPRSINCSMCQISTHVPRLASVARLFTTPSPRSGIQFVDRRNAGSRTRV